MIIYTWNGDDSQWAEVTVQDPELSIMYSDLQLNEDMHDDNCMYGYIMVQEHQCSHGNKRHGQ